MSQVDVELESKVNEIYVKTTVTQKFTNPEENPLELKISLFKNPDLLFTSFQAKIGNSITVKSKLIKKEKATVKYTDSIASGNAAIFVAETDENIIINMGNIPPKEEVIFISEFLHFIKFTDYYEFEIFRNLPIFIGKDDKKYANNKLKENIYIKTKNKISTLSKDINISELKIKEEKYLNEEKNEYYISYEIEKLPIYYYKKNNSSKIYFDTIYTEPKVFLQKSSKFNEDNYIIQYKHKELESESEIYPALFIFLIDQSGSMRGSRIEIAKKALELFIQSLPAKSYYQLIGFGSNFVEYDKTPKEYTKENIEKSIKIIQDLKANLNCTDILSPLKNIFKNKIYDQIDLTKNIFLLTDGDVDDKEGTLNEIESNNSKFRIVSIGIGEDFDEDLIKRSGILGKGGYNYCKDLSVLNSVVAKEINNVNNPWIAEFKLNCDLDNENMIKKTEVPDFIKSNDIINFHYIIPRKNIDKIKFEIIIKIDGKKGKREEIKKNYEIISMEFPEGEEFSKLLIKNDLKNYSEKEKLDKALKYQILYENTSLFSEIELSNQITEEMKTKIIGDEKNNVMEIYKPKENYHSNNYNMNQNLMFMGMDPMMSMNMNPMIQMGMNNMNPMNAMSMGMNNMNPMNAMSMGMNNMNPMMSMNMNRMNQMGMMNNGMNPLMFNNQMNYNMNQMNNNMNQMMVQMVQEQKRKKEEEQKRKKEEEQKRKKEVEEKRKKEEEEEERREKEEEEREKKIKILEEKNKKIMEEKEKERKYEEESNMKKAELERKKSEEKEKLMKIIKTQDYIDGFWDVNDMTKFIFEKYKKKYDLLKEKNFDDKVAMTILMIYYLKTEHFKLLTELLMIIKKGEVYIKKETKSSYEEIIENIK